MDRPTAAAIRAIAPVQFDWSSFGYPAGDPDPLEARVEYAIARLRLETGRTLDSITDVDEQAVARHAIALLTMQETLGGSSAVLAVQGQPWLKSFTAGSYSETRFSPGELAGNAGANADVLARINPWPALARDLWLLATQEQRDAWVELYTGRYAPEGGIFEHWADPCGPDVVWPYGARGWPS